MVWAAISWHSLGPILVLDGRVTAKDYQTILEDHVHPMVQTLYPEGGAMYQDDNAPIHTARLVKDWFDEHESEVEHLPWPAQSPDLNIIEPNLYSMMVNNKSPSTASWQDRRAAAVRDCRTERFRRSIVPTAIRLFNSNCEHVLLEFFRLFIYVFFNLLHNHCKYFN